MIRKATQADFGAIMQLAVAMHAEAPNFNRWPLDIPKLRQTLTVLIDDDRKSFVWVAVDRDTIVGALAATIYDHWSLAAKFAQDFGVYMDPRRRGGINAIRLIEQYRHWAFAHGAEVAEVGVTTGINDEMTGELLERLGAQRVGALYRWSRPCA